MVIYIQQEAKTLDVREGADDAGLREETNSKECNKARLWPTEEMTTCQLGNENREVQRT